MSTLVVDRTWDGLPLPPAFRSSLHLAEEADGLVLSWLAPDGDTPAPATAPGPTDGLWTHEVVELFLAGSGPGYLEVEVGPHGHHLVIQLLDVRVRGAWPLPLDVAVARIPGEVWAGQAHLPRAWLPTGPLRAAAFRVAPQHRPPHLASVRLPGDAANFHQPHHFPPLGPLPTASSFPLAALLEAGWPELRAAHDAAIAAGRAAHALAPLRAAAAACAILLHSDHADGDHSG